MVYFKLFVFRNNQQSLDYCNVNPIPARETRSASNDQKLFPGQQGKYMFDWIYWSLILHIDAKLMISEEKSWLYMYSCIYMGA